MNATFHHAQRTHLSLKVACRTILCQFLVKLNKKSFVKAKKTGFYGTPANIRLNLPKISIFSSIFLKFFKTNSTIHYFSIALILTIFCGCCGLDRCYLGYFGLGCFKFLTVGFFGLMWILDLLLIVTQTLRPWDNSNYIVWWNGPRLEQFFANRETRIIIGHG